MPNVASTVLQAELVKKIVALTAQIHTLEAKAPVPGPVGPEGKQGVEGK